MSSGLSAAAGVFAQATLASSLCRLSGAAPLMEIRRGFMASGTSQDSSILSKPIVELRALHPDVVGQVELPLERPRGDAAIEVFALGRLGLVALDRHDVLLGGDRDFGGSTRSDRLPPQVTHSATE